MTKQEMARKLLKERNDRDPLRWFAATPSQELFLRRDTAKDPFCLLNAINRCLAPWQTIYDPLQKKHLRVDSVDGPWHVFAWDGHGIVVAEAERPFKKPKALLLTIRLSDGSSISCSPRHLLLLSSGKWIQASSLCLLQCGQHLSQSTWDTCLQESRAGDPRWSDINEDSLADCRLYGRLYGPPLRLAGAFAPGLAPLPNDVPGYNHQTCDPGQSVAHLGGPAYTAAHSLTYQSSCRPSSQDALGQSEALYAACESYVAYTAEKSAIPAIQAFQRSSGAEVGQSQRIGEAGLFAPVLGRGCVGRPWHPPELHIIGVDDHGQGDVWDFTVPRFHNYVAGNCINHNSGKSAAACVDLSLTARGIHPHRTNYKNLVIVQFTPTRAQANDVIGRKLFDDSELKFPDSAPKSVLHQPMIPPWEIEELSRPLLAGKRTPVHCKLKNGNQIIFTWSGAADQDKRIAGMRWDAAYIDEEAGTPELFAEMAARLLDAQSDGNRPGLGYFVWAYTNTRYNEAYENFKIRSEQGAPGHKTYILLPGENPAVSAEARERMAGLMSEDQANIRMRGGADAGDLVSIYGRQWNDERHILPAEYQIDPSDNLWVGYDPGVDHPMGMMIAAINKENPLRLNIAKCWMYRGETIEKDADNLAAWLQGRKIAGFVYDTNLKNRDRGGGPSVLQRFKELLANRGVNPLSGFWQSKKNHAPGIAMVRHYLDPNPDDRTVPPLLVISKPTEENGTGILRQQLLKYRGKEATRFTGHGGVVKKDDELCDTVRYLALQRPSYNPQWACGGASINATSGVAKLYTDDKIPSTTMVKPPEQPRFDFTKRVFLARSRDRRATGGWSVTAL